MHRDTARVILRRIVQLADQFEASDDVVEQGRLAGALEAETTLLVTGLRQGSGGIANPPPTCGAAE